MYRFLVLHFMCLSMLIGCTQASSSVTQEKSELFNSQIYKLEVYLNGTCYDEKNQLVSLEDMRKLKRKRVKFSTSKEFSEVSMQNDRIRFGKPQSIFKKEKFSNGVINVSFFS